jgi:putative dehydrogenase
MTEKAPVGVVGIGLIGGALAGRLLAAGYPVLGYDVDPAKREALAARGGAGVASLPELFRKVDRVLVSVFNTEQVEDVMEGKGGLREIAAETGRDKLAIVVSTCDPERVQKLGDRLTGSRAHLLEMPISGASGQVAAGDGVGLLGGSKADAEWADDLLKALVKKCHFMGATGNGGRTKLAVNLILGLNRAGLGEGLVFAEAIGLPLPAFLDAARDSAAYSQIMDVKGDMMIRDQFTPPQGRIVQATKDVHLMMQAAEAAGQELPLGRTYLDLLEKSMAAGDADIDNSGVMREIRRRRQ